MAPVKKFGSYTPLLLLLARLVLAGTFVLAAIPKIGDPIAFGAAVEGFQIVDGARVNWIAVILPWFELIVGIGLLVPMIRRSSAICISILLVTFISLHASAWQRGLDISCGCFGTEAELTTNYGLLILRNLALLSIAIWVLRRDLKIYK